MSTTSRGQVWGLIPARGGSKTIERKNLVPVCGQQLVGYVAQAGRCAASLDRLICSTDDPAIAEACAAYGVPSVRRPERLAGDDVPTADVMVDLLRGMDPVPEAICLLQPTSPFVLPEHIDSAVQALLDDPEADSVQTVVDIPHHHHAFNQRVMDGDLVRFRFPTERRGTYNKQRKPRHFALGNLVVVRSSSILSTGDIFGARSIGLPIGRWYGVDVDTQDDVELAEWVIRSGRVILDHVGVLEG